MEKNQGILQEYIYVTLFWTSEKNFSYTGK